MIKYSDDELNLLNKLKDDNIQVVSIRGDWGCGKTYFWNNFIKKCLDNEEFESYAYASILGMSSINEVEKHLSRNILKKSGKSKTKKFLSKFFDAVKGHKGYGIIPPPENFERFFFDLPKDRSIICLDDIERMDGKSLNFNIICGLVTRLKLNGCKIVLILNETESLSSEITALKEKMIDFEISYQPSIESNLRHIWIGNELTEDISRFFIDNKINNIRVMKKNKMAIGALSDARLEMQSKQILIRQILPILSMHYHDKIKIKSISEINMYKCYKKEDQNHAIVEKYKYDKQDIDGLIIDYIDKGKVDFHEFDKEITKLNQLVSNQEVRDKYRLYWDKINYDYTANDTIAHEFIDFMISESRSIGCIESINTLWHLSNFIPINDINENIKRIIDIGGSQCDFVFDLDRLHQKFDKDILKYINNSRSKFLSKQKRPLKGFLIASQNFNREQWSEILIYTKDEFKEFILGIKNVEEQRIIEYALNRVIHIMKSVDNELVKALLEIQKIDGLSRRKVNLIFKDFEELRKYVIVSPIENPADESDAKSCHDIAAGPPSSPNVTPPSR